MADKFPMKDVVVLIPGIGGSVLQRDGKDIWALAPGAALRGVLSLGGSIKKLRLDGDDPGLDDLGDGVVATQLMPDLHVLPGLGWKIDGYGRIRSQLLSRFDCTPGKNYFELPYDWRRDNRVAARSLAQQAKTWLAEWQESSGHDGAKLVLIGHSMGGIVARLYLELLEGWKDTRALVTYGTPFSGSVNAIDFLANGFKKGWGPFSIDLSSMLRSFTSVYQLLPSYRCLEAQGGKWEYLDSVNWKPDRIDQARLVAALDLQRDLRKAVDDRLAAGGEPAYQVRPIIGDFQPTSWAARRKGDGVETLRQRSPEESGGDGTVPTVSASPHELLKGWANAMFASQRHASLQNDSPVLDHTIGVLRAVLTDGQPVFPAGDERVALEVDDVTTEEPFVIRARPAQLGAPLEVTVVPAVDPPGHGPPPVPVPLTPATDGWQQATLDGLAPGDYRVTVVTPGVHRVAEVASVVDLAGVEADAAAVGRGG